MTYKVLNQKTSYYYKREVQAKNQSIKDYIFKDEEVSEVKYVYYKELEKMAKERVEGLLMHQEEYNKLFEFIRKKLFGG